MLWIHTVLIQGSRDQLAFDQSPGLIAVFHALHRLLAPRHPPHALSSLTALILSSVRKPGGLRPTARLSSARTKISYRAHRLLRGRNDLILFSQAHVESTLKKLPAVRLPSRLRS